MPLRIINLAELMVKIGVPGDTYQLSVILVVSFVKELLPVVIFGPLVRLPDESMAIASVQEFGLQLLRMEVKILNSRTISA